MYFEKESLQNNIGDDLDKRNRNFEKIESDTVVSATNLVTNGDFSSDVIGWSSTVGSSSVIDGIATFTATGIYGKIYQLNPMGTTGRKVYYSGLVKASSASVALFMHGSPIQKWHSGSNTYERLSLIYDTYTVGVGSQIGIADYRGSAWTPIYVDNLIAIDLTATFGAGKEPTVEQMDKILTQFPNSWFNATENLFLAKQVLDRVNELDSRTEMVAQNIVTNGDFSNGITGWTGSKLTVANGVASFYSDNTNGATVGYPNFAQFTKSKASNKYYISYQVVSYANVSAVSFFQLGSAVIQYFSTTGLKSAIYTPSVDSSAFYFNNSVNAGGIVDFKIDNVSIIDLTATFGAGKEPTLAEMDRLMTHFSNSWFDGKQPLNTIRNLYTDKANKVQEAWITPTLLNGWTEMVKYAKNDLGQVTLKFNLIAGTTTIATTICSLPAGYRPTYIVGIRGNNPTSGPNCDFRLQANGNLEIIGGASTGNFVQGEIVFSTN